MRRRVMLAAAVVLTGAIASAPRVASAEGLFDFLFGGLQKQQQRQTPPQASFFADPFGANQQPAPPPRPVASAGGSGPAFCVRSCDGRYFPLARGNATPVQLCQAFCPASPTKVFFGGNIDSASSTTGERYADSENAYVYRKTMRADCTCNGRDPAGLAPIDLTLDTSLRPGDVIATTDGLVAYSGVKVGDSQTAEFTPVASYPGLTADVRARLGEMKVAPVSAETVADETPAFDTGPDAMPVTSVPKSTLARGKRAEVD
ncbi:DUF2865 domain-containing protein [Bradyrhizobium canariense]|nr:DUF2865 domain-containing protein [Bradyrhizobium canariense]